MPKGLSLKKCACGKRIKVFKNKRYTRLHSDICQKCALKIGGFVHGHRSLDKDGNVKRSSLYIKWVQMKGACFNLKNKDFRLIGAKGIGMSLDWMSYDGFLKWATNSAWPTYSEGMSLKRRDVSKHFNPENCEFVLGRVNRFYEYEKITKTFQEWKNHFNSNLSDEIIRNRLEKDWDLKRAFTQEKGVRVYGL